MGKSAGQQENFISIPEVAKALGYSRQRIGQIIRKLSIGVTKQGNKTLLTPCQADAIAAYLHMEPISKKIIEDKQRQAQEDQPQAEESQEQEQPQEEETQDQPQGDSVLDTVLVILQEQVRAKDRQIELLQSLLESKDRQIDTLLETNKALSASQAAKQVAETKELLLADNKPQEVSEQQPQKISFGQWLKSRFQA